MLQPITITTLDEKRLSSLLLTRVGMAYRTEAVRLREELRRAIVAASESVPPSLVTMNSRLIYAHLETRAVQEISLVYPWSARDRASVSILSEIGTALLGLRVGESIAWPFRDGSIRTFRVVALPYQPEAVGAWHL